MAIRLRRTDDAGLIAICAARSIQKEGDVYLDDEAHAALSDKFDDDFRTMGFLRENIAPPPADHPSYRRLVAMQREESDNPNRKWWDQEYAAPQSPVAPLDPPFASLADPHNWPDIFDAPPNMMAEGFAQWRALTHLANEFANAPQVRARILEIRDSSRQVTL